MTIRVVHVVRQYHPSIGGMEDVVRNIAVSQGSVPGQEARIVTLNRLFRNGNGLLKSSEEIDGVPVVRLPYSGSSRYPLCPQVLRQVAGADVVHVHGVDFFYDFLAVTKQLHRRPLVLSTHGGFFHTAFASGLKETWFRTITRLSSLAYDRIVATSENDGHRFGQIINPNRLEVIENGVNTDKYAGKGSRELNRTLLYFGRWSSNKGLLEAMDLVERLTVDDDRWHLIIAGREYDYTLDDLTREVNQRQLRNHVTLVANPDDDALKDLMNSASYFLCLSRHEGFGLAAIEAMSAGLTPVLSNIPPFRRLVDEAGMGIVADTVELSGMADQLTALHARGQLAHEQRRESAMGFAERYSWRRIATRYIDLYDRLGGQS